MGRVSGHLDPLGHVRHHRVHGLTASFLCADEGPQWWPSTSTRLIVDGCEVRLAAPGGQERRMKLREAPSLLLPTCGPGGGRACRLGTADTLKQASGFSEGETGRVLPRPASPEHLGGESHRMCFCAPPLSSSGPRSWKRPQAGDGSESAPPCPVPSGRLEKRGAIIQVTAVPLLLAFEEASKEKH